MRETIVTQAEYRDDDDEDTFYETMEYIPPDLTALTNLKLKPKSKPRTVPYGKAVKQSRLLERALTTEAPSPDPDSSLFIYEASTR